MIKIDHKKTATRFDILGEDVDLLYEVCDMARLFLKEKKEENKVSGLDAITENKVYGFIEKILEAFRD